MIMPSLKAADTSNPQDMHPARDSEIASTYVSLDSSLELSGRSQNAAWNVLEGGALRDLRAAANIALHPEWQLCLEEQTEWWHFPLLSTTGQRNAEFMIQPSFNLLGRTR